MLSKFPPDLLVWVGSPPPPIQIEVAEREREAKEGRKEGVALAWRKWTEFSRLNPGEILIEWFMTFLPCCSKAKIFTHDYHQTVWNRRKLTHIRPNEMKREQREKSASTTFIHLLHRLLTWMWVESTHLVEISYHHSTTIHTRYTAIQKTVPFLFSLVRAGIKVWARFNPIHMTGEDWWAQGVEVVQENWTYVKQKWGERERETLETWKVQVMGHNLIWEFIRVSKPHPFSKFICNCYRFASSRRYICIYLTPPHISSCPHSSYFFWHKSSTILSSSQETIWQLKIPRVFAYLIGFSKRRRTNLVCTASFLLFPSGERERETKSFFVVWFKFLMVYERLFTDWRESNCRKYIVNAKEGDVEC